VRGEQLKHLIIGAAIAIAIVVPLAAYAFVRSGIYNVGASSPHSKFTSWLTHETMIHSVRRHARDVAVPTRVSGREVLAGFCAYETHCVACHGAAGVARHAWVSGLEPSPPYLLDVAHQFTPQQLFWITQNGIKMTGMPAWRDSMSDEQIWQIVSFLEAMPAMDSALYRQWRSSGSCTPGPKAVSRDLAAR
jgi:mono/diheme cytochrome c family protein